jgi:hypothetical protein
MDQIVSESSTINASTVEVPSTNEDLKRDEELSKITFQIEFSSIFYFFCSIIQLLFFKFFKNNQNFYHF